MSPSTLIHLAAAFVLVNFALTVTIAVLTIINLKRVKTNKLEIVALSSLLGLSLQLQCGETPSDKEIERASVLIDMLSRKQIN